MSPRVLYFSHQVLRHVRRFTQTECSPIRHPVTLAAANQLVPLIGLEIHAQLNSKTKLFSRAPYSFGAPPNSQLDLFDAAIPGSMPILNRRCVEATLLIALALQAHINSVSQFDRKHYFYADSPAGYQITQYWRPIAERGFLDYLWPVDETVDRELPSESRSPTQIVKNAAGKSYHLSRARIQRLQIEQDTGKSIHDDRHGRSLIDLNRAGVGLVELVTEPDFSHSSQAAAFVRELAGVLQFLGSCSCNASLGELRVDVNVSVGPSVWDQGARTEVKNVNSIRAVAQAIDYEIDRQLAVVNAGGHVINETRAFDPVSGHTLPMRDKEVLQDYRYLPEPNLPPLRLRSTCSLCHPDATMEALSSDRICLHCMHQRYTEILAQNSDGQLPNDIRQRLLINHSLSWDKAMVLVESNDLLGLFDQTRAVLQSREMDQCTSSAVMDQELGYWICGQLHGMTKQKALDRLPDVNHLAGFVELNLRHQIHGSVASDLLKVLCSDEPPSGFSSPLQWVTKQGWLSCNDPTHMHDICACVIADHPKAVKHYSTGNVRKAMRRLLQALATDKRYREAQLTHGSFHPVVAEKVLQKLLLLRSHEPSTK